MDHNLLHLGSTSVGLLQVLTHSDPACSHVEHPRRESLLLYPLRFEQRTHPGRGAIRRQKGFQTERLRLRAMQLALPFLDHVFAKYTLTTIHFDLQLYDLQLIPFLPRLSELGADSVAFGLGFRRLRGEEVGVCLTLLFGGFGLALTLHKILVLKHSVPSCCNLHLCLVFGQPPSEMPSEFRGAPLLQILACRQPAPQKLFRQ